MAYQSARQSTRRQLLLLVTLLSLSSAATSAWELTQRWQLEAVFSMPESAVIDAVRGYVYVSNVNTYAKDNNGFISRVTLDGSQLDLQWLSGLHSPTGMAIAGATLYVADYDSLVEINLDTATIVNRFAAPDPVPALNDVAIAPDGEVYVSGSGSSSIFVLREGQLSLWLHDDVLLLQANGLLAQEDILIHGGNTWHVFDRASKELLTEQIQPHPATRDIDGITGDGCGGYLYTLLEDARIQRVTAAGNSLVASAIDYEGIDLHLAGNLLALPQVGGSLTLFELNLADCGTE